MKVSVNWLRHLNDHHKSSADPMPKGIDDLVEKIGAQLGAVEEVVNPGKKYKGIMVAKVVSCIKHPNADKLSLCLIDDGKVAKSVKRNKDGLVEVVCGAPNVATGQLVAWLPPGTTVPATFDKDPFVLEAREIRGIVSNGMIASMKELDLGDNHDGILVVDKPAKPGQAFAEVYELDDHIIDIENKMFTHRPDLFGLMGIARELAGIQGHAFRSPKWYLDQPKPNNHSADKKMLDVKNEIPKLVPRFMMQIVKNVKVEPSPIWLQTYLVRVGIRPINNIVDVTNVVMYLTAQPIHAYDYDKVKGVSSGSQAKVLVRSAKKDEKILLLGGKVITMGGGEMVIATNKQSIGLAGVMGGAVTEVDEQTKNIIIEVGNFNMNETRRSAMAHGLFTDAATRFTKNQSPLQNDRILAFAVGEMVKAAGGMPARHTYDLKGQIKTNPVVKLSVEFINQRLGLKLSASQIKKLLINVEFMATGGDKLSVQAPFWRTDIEIPEDVVEEVGRLYGYDHLPQILPSRDLSPAKKNARMELKTRIRQILLAAGANEILTYSFVPGSLMEQTHQNLVYAFHIKNALSPDLQYYRLSLTPSLLEKVQPNIKTGVDNFVIYELGKVHSKTEVEAGLPKQFERLALVYASRSGKEKQSGAAYFWAKKYLEHLFGRFGLRPDFKLISGSKFKNHELFQQLLAPYEPSRTAIVMIGDKLAGAIGEYRSDVKTALKLPELTAGFEVFLSCFGSSSFEYSELNQFPSLDQDLTLRAPADKKYQTLEDFITDFLSREGAKHGYQSQVVPLDRYQKPGGKDIQTSWHLTFEHPERTLTTEEINRLLDELAKQAKIKLGAERI